MSSVLLILQRKSLNFILTTVKRNSQACKFLEN